MPGNLKCQILPGVWVNLQWCKLSQIGIWNFVFSHSHPICNICIPYTRLWLYITNLLYVSIDPSPAPHSQHSWTTGTTAAGRKRGQPSSRRRFRRVSTCQMKQVVETSCNCRVAQKLGTATDQLVQLGPDFAKLVVFNEYWNCRVVLQALTKSRMHFPWEPSHWTELLECVIDPRTRSANPFIYQPIYLDISIYIYIVLLSIVLKTMITYILIGNFPFLLVCTVI